MGVHRIFKNGLAVFYIERGGDFGDEGIESCSEKFDVARPPVYATVNRLTYQMIL